ncbi:MAG: F0F1 ATP synthase subunit B [Clostridia bacterium]
MLSLDMFTFAFGALNLIVLYIVLRKLLFKRVTAFMSNRTNSIKMAIESAEIDRASAADLKHIYEDSIRGAKIEADRIIDESKLKSYREYDAIVNEARQDSANILTKAREEIEYEKIEMLKDVKNQVATLALAVASKVIEANMDTESNKALVEKFIDEAGAA